MLKRWRKLAWLLAVLCACSARATAPSSGGLANGQPARAAEAASPALSSVEPGRDAPLADAATARTEVLRVGTSGDYAPFSSRDSAGKLVGFDVEIAERMARDLGFDLQWVPFRWPELGKDLSAGAFDVAMGGVSWNPTRAVTGYITRAVGRGGPCVLGDAAAPRIAVNRGGILEGWARGRFGDRELIAVDDNQSLPTLLADRRVGAIVTDSFERAAFQRPGWTVRCELAQWQKAYWIGPAAARARELGPRVDAWLRTNAAHVQAAQERWFGQRQRLDANSHLVDMLARRLAFMPIVAASKAAKNLPIEDLPRERQVLAAVGQSAKEKGLPEPAVVALFALQIELSKAVQRRLSEASSLDLGTQVRPALDELGGRILDALVEARAGGQLGSMKLEDLDSLAPWLSSEERSRLLSAVRAVDA